LGTFDSTAHTLPVLLQFTQSVMLNCGTLWIVFQWRNRRRWERRWCHNRSPNL